MNFDALHVLCLMSTYVTGTGRFASSPEKANDAKVSFETIWITPVV